MVNKPWSYLRKPSYVSNQQTKLKEKRDFQYFQAAICMMQVQLNLAFAWKYFCYNLIDSHKHQVKNLATTGLISAKKDLKCKEI